MKKCLIQAVIALLLNLVLQSTSLNCKEGDLQLDYNSTKATSPATPLVMICVQGQWGYVCGREQPAVSPWEIENVGVACQQLGFIRASGSIKIPELDNPLSNQSNSTLPVHYRFVYCTGVERRLIDCAHGESPNNGHTACKKKVYGAVACSEKPVVCEAGELKIINNTLLICSQGEWYTLCGDTDSWTQAQARVACRQMGLNPIGAKASYLIEENMKRLSVVFHCEGDEDSLLDCSSSVIWCSTSSFIATIECGDPTSPPQNLSATLNKQVITISWDHNHSDAVFMITCSNGQVSFSTRANGTNEAIINGIKLLPDTQYECCVIAVTPVGESKSVCEGIAIVPVGGGGVTSSSSEEISSYTFPSSAIDHSASSSTSPVIPWSVGLLIGIIVGVTAIIIVWIGQVIVCRRKKNYSIRHQALEMPSNVVTNQAYHYIPKTPNPQSQPLTFETKHMDANIYSLAVSDGSECCNVEQQK